MPQPRHILRRTFNVLLVIAAYGFLAWLLYSYDNYPALIAHFRSAGVVEWGCFVVALLLVPLNILCEAWKWRYLLKDIAPMGLVEAQKQVYCGFVGAFFTPERLGDYPARVTRIADKSMWLPAITLGFVGTMALSTINISGGVLSLLCSGITIGGITRRHAFLLAGLFIAFFIVCIVLLPKIAAWLLPRRPWKDTMRALLAALTTFSPVEFPVLVAMSLCRYLVYATQLVLVLVFCGVGLTPAEMAVVVPIHYFFVTLTPTVTAADAAVRGSVGALVFSYFTPNTAAVAFAAIILWLFNSMIPMMIGSFMGKKK